MDESWASGEHWEMISEALSRGLVVAQFFSLGGLVLCGWRGVIAQTCLLGIALSAITLGFHALQMMGSQAFRVGPEPKDTAKLCLRGAYRWIRHPIYLAVLLLCGTLIIGSGFQWLALVLAGFLMIVILIKIHFEEAMWALREPEHYQSYQVKTKRLIPFLF